MAWLAARTHAPADTLPWLRERLRRGGVFLAVDALEELPKDDREVVFLALKAFADDYPAAASPHSAARCQVPVLPMWSHWSG